MVIVTGSAIRIENLNGGFMNGTTKASGWALFWFLVGFTVLGTAAAGGGLVSLIAGSVILVISAGLFKAARKIEEGT